MNKVSGKIIKLFWLVFAISMFLILGTALSKPLNNLIPQRMVLFTLVWIVFYGVMWAICCLIEKKLPGAEKIIRCCLPIYLILLGAALFVVSLCLRSEPITDYESVYEAAYHFAMGEEVTNWNYFSRWYNNVGCMMGLAVLFFLGRWLPEGLDPYYFVLFCNVVQVVLVVYCLYYLVKKLIKNRPVAAPLMTLLVCATWIPIWANTSIFYSDQLSFGAAVFGMALVVKGYEKRNWVPYYCLAGVCFGVGVIMKVTAATVLVALVIACVLFRKLWAVKGRLLLVLACCLAVNGSFSLFCKTLPYQEDLDILKAPVEYWFAIGLVGSGTFADSEEFAMKCLTADNLEIRTEMAREQIAKEIHNLWNPEHIIAKARTNFGCGDMGAAGYLLFPKEENLLWNWFSMEGQYYWKYACLSTAFFFALLFFLGVGGLLQFFKKENEPASFVAALAFWGLCLFLMLWEAQDKQLYNHSGVMIFALIATLDLLGKRAEAQVAGRKNEQGDDSDVKNVNVA